MLEDWAKRKPMQLTHEKFKVLFPDWNNSIQLWADQVAGGLYHTPSWIWGPGVVLSHLRQTAYWDKLVEFSLIDKGTYYLLLLREATPELLYPAFGPPIQGWCGEAGENLAEGNQDDQQPTSYSLWGEVEVPGLADRQQPQASPWEVQAGHCEYLFQHWNAGKW